MNDSKIRKRKKPPMPGTKRKVIVRKRSDHNETKTLTLSKEKKSNAKKTWNIEKVREFAKIRGGKCLSKVYTNTRDKYKFKCHRGHIFEKKLSCVLYSGGWCPKCVIYVGEEITRKVMNTLFGKRFIKTRPKWLDGMELDGYNKELMLAFEYDGRQHFKFIKRFHKSKEEFLSQQKRDRLKNELCAKNDVTLIRIPYTVKYEDIKDYICQKCEQCDINIPHNMDIDHRLFEGVYTKNASYHRLKKIVEDKNMKLLDEYFIGWLEKIEMECIKGHRISMRANNVKNSNGCTMCSGSRNFTIENVKEDALLHNCECLDDDYTSIHEPINLKCSKGHLFQMKYKLRKSIGGVWCPLCKSNKSKVEKIDKMYQKICDMAINLEGKCINPKYVDYTSKMKFKCKKGHIFQITPQNLLTKKSWCHSCRVGKRSISDMKKLAGKYDGECLSTEYKNLITPLEWKCKNGHVFMRKAQYIYNGKGFCMECKKY